MKEKLKSLVLGLLVLASLTLSYALWYGSPPYEFSKPMASEPIHFSSSRSLQAMITPDRVVFHRGEGLYHVFTPGQELFQVGVNLFKNCLDALILMKPLEVMEAAGPDAGENENDAEGEEEVGEHLPPAGIRLDFPYPYPLEAPGQPPVDIAQFFLSLEGDEAWLKTPGGDYYALTLAGVGRDLLLRFDRAEGLPTYRLADEEDLPPEAAAVFTREVYLPEGEVGLPVQRWEQERLDVDRLLKVFFIDMSLVRRIDEKDGAVIYTDGQKGVRIYPAGAVEYTAAVAREGLLSGSPALAMAGEIIALYGGWTAGLYLWTPPGPEPPESRQQLLFTPYAGGRPLISSEGGVSLSVSSRGVQSYFRNVMLPANEPQGEPQGMLPLISAPEAFAKAVEYALQERVGMGPLRIQGFYPGYYLREPLSEHKQAVTAWFLELEGLGLVVMNAASGLPAAVLRF